MRKTGKIVFLVAPMALAIWGGACSVSGNSTSSSTDSPTPSPTPNDEKRRLAASPTESYPEANQLSTLQSVKLSKWVVLAKSVASEVRLMPDKNIFTFSDFEVLESVKGDYPDKTLTLRVVGGSTGDVRVTRPFQTEFSPSRKYVLFLGNKNAFGYPTINPQSIFAIDIEPETNSEFISPRPDLPLYNAETGELRTRKLTKVALKDFLYSIKKVE